MRAILSDIHGNFEALTAVLADMRAHGVTQIYCLGDIIGYGPNPRECLDAAMSFDLTVLGNHDQAALFDPMGFSPAAERAIFWTRSQLDGAPESRIRREARWEFLSERPLTFQEDRYLFVHGSPRNPLNEYIFPEDIYQPRKMNRIFALIEQYCFHGHTHVAGIITEEPDQQTFQYHAPEELDYSFTLDARKTLINVGSVGQPRDTDWRASYVLFDGETVYFRRVEYDLDAVMEKIRVEPDLDDFLADRLREGR